MEYEGRGGWGRRGRGRECLWWLSRREVMVTEEMAEWTDLRYVLEVTSAGLTDGLPVGGETERSQAELRPF